MSDRHLEQECHFVKDSDQVAKRQATAIDLLLKGFCMSEVARRVGVSKRTVYRWRYNHPQFIAVYARITQELHEQTARRAEQLVYKAMGIVGDAMSEGKKESARIPAQKPMTPGKCFERIIRIHSIRERVYNRPI